jgi:glutamate-ammonia-ligase adenylyltransferase
MPRPPAAIAEGAPDPADAVLRFERIADAARAAGRPLADITPAELHVLAVSCQRAPYLAALLARDPARLRRVAADPYLAREKPRGEQAAELAARIAADPAAAAGDDDAFAAALRRYRADEIVRLGVREFGLGTDIEVGRELARLAEVAFDAAIAHHAAALTARIGPPRWTDDAGRERDAELAVIGMGKLGGEELNFASDVDVIYLYSSDAGRAGDRTLHEYFTELCRRVTAAVGDVTDEGVVFRVDLRLRPEGSRGPIANSLPSAERYYEAWGRPWERQAWLKARPCAGSLALGAEAVRALEPFVHPRAASPRVIDDVAELNRRIKAELDASGVDSGFDVKNGVGGIREIEFFVQALQLIHAGRQPALRARSTLAALDQLVFAGIIAAAEQRTLATAYRFLRHVEHVLQLEGGRQTQRLPTDRARLAALARRLDLADAAALADALRAHTAEVARLFATLGDGGDAAVTPEIALLLAADAPPERVRAALAALGFRDPEQAARDLEDARRRPSSPLGPTATGAAARIAPELLVEVAASPDPDQALRYLVDLIARRGSWSAVWQLFDDNRQVMRLIASLFGTSAYLARTFASHPELIDVLLGAGRARDRVSVAELRAAAAERFAGLDADDEEARWNALAELKATETLRIGLADIAGSLDAEQVSQELSALAEATLKEAVAIVSASLRARHGWPRDDVSAPVELALLALGKLGGRELGYASDLDILFVYSADGASDGPRPLPTVEYMTRLAQRLVGALHAMHPTGRLYETDTRLRPEGQKGLLVSSLAGWQSYHRDHARLWERQALIKLRPVAGDAALGDRVAALAADHVWGVAPGAGGREDAAALARAVIEMRDKIERELAGGASFNVKTGRGGLIDVEFAAQYLQLAHGHAHPELRTPSTVAALAAAARAGVAEPRRCALLIDGWRFFRTLEHRLRIVHDRSEQRLPVDPAELDKLARRVRYPDAAALEAACRRWASDVRAAYEAIVVA